VQKYAQQILDAPAGSGEGGDRRDEVINAWRAAGKS
jgi:hypothetical protein